MLSLPRPPSCVQALAGAWISSEDEPGSWGSRSRSPESDEAVHEQPSVESGDGAARSSRDGGVATAGAGVKEVEEKEKVVAKVCVCVCVCGCVWIGEYIAKTLLPCAR